MPGSTVTTACSGQRRFGRRREPGGLVHLEPEPVAERVAERIAEAPGRDHLAGERVALAAGHARRGGARARGRCAARTSSYTARWRSSARPPTTTVRVRSAQYPSTCAPKSSSSQSPAAIVRAARPGVGQRRPRAAGDDGRETDATRCPRRRSAASSAAAIVELGLPHPDGRQHLRQRLLRELRGGADRRHLLRRLDRPEALDQVARSGPAGSA